MSHLTDLMSRVKNNIWISFFFRVKRLLISSLDVIDEVIGDKWQFGNTRKFKHILKIKIKKGCYCDIQIVYNAVLITRVTRSSEIQCLKTKLVVNGIVNEDKLLKQKLNLLLFYLLFIFFWKFKKKLQRECSEKKGKFSKKN